MSVVIYLSIGKYNCISRFDGSCFLEIPRNVIEGHFTIRIINDFISNCPSQHIFQYIEEGFYKLINIKTEHPSSHLSTIASKLGYNELKNTICEYELQYIEPNDQIEFIDLNHAYTTRGISTLQIVYE